jgi:uncharacterized membrane protein
MSKDGLFVISKWLLGLFYLFAGINHFWHPEFYLPLIPDYLPWKVELNQLVGLLEIGLGVGVLLKATRRFAAWGIIILLVLLIPAHVYFIQIGSCIPDGLCVEPWVAWMRLILIHPLLMAWAYWHVR